METNAARPPTRSRTPDLSSIRSRITRYGKCRGADLIPDDRNWRTHDSHQRAMISASLQEVGIVDVLLVRETPEGLKLVDGHARASLHPDVEYDVAVLDVDDDEAAKVMAMLDPIGAMAGRDEAALRGLVARFDTDSAALREMWAKMANAGDGQAIDVPYDAALEAFTSSDQFAKGKPVKLVFPITREQANNLEFKTSLSAFCAEWAIKYRVQG